MGEYTPSSFLGLNIPNDRQDSMITIDGNELL